MKKNIIILTMGDPAGIGPEVLIKSYKKACKKYNLVAVSDFDKIIYLAQKYGVVLRKINHIDEAKQFKNCLNILHTKYEVNFLPGQLDTANSAAIINSIKIATELCLRNEVGAMVTGPINKAILKSDKAFKFSGHTDYLEYLCKSKKDTATMMMLNPYLKIVPLTIHEPLSNVSSKINKYIIERKLNIIISEFRKYLKTDPKIAVLGLNPHAGESGHIGHEDSSEISPAIKKVKKDKNCFIDGPFSADGFFGNRDFKNYDVTIAMYHDQALIPLKLLSFPKSINVTLGLPIIRTSPGHGTGINIAKELKADFSSFYQAILFAGKMMSNSVNSNIKPVF